jgi:hypothetical protein
MNSEAVSAARPSQCSIACAIDLHIVRLRLRPNACGSDEQLASETGQPLVSVVHLPYPARRRAVLGEVAHGGRITSISSCNQVNMIR